MSHGTNGGFRQVETPMSHGTNGESRRIAAEGDKEERERRRFRLARAGRRLLHCALLGQGGLPMRRFWAGAGIVVVLALAVRLLPVLVHGGHPGLFMDPDSWGYHRLACNLLAGHGYSWNEAPPYEPNLYRPPGLPLLLTGLYAVVGPSVEAAIVLQAIVGTVTVALLMALVRVVLRSDRLALWSGIALALDPVAIQYSNLLLTETWTALLLVVAAWFVLRFAETEERRWLIGSGALLGVGILIHPLLLFLPAGQLVLPWLRAATRTPRCLAAGALAALLAWTPAAAWIARNYQVGEFAGISSVTAVNLLKYKAAGVEALRRGTSRQVERDRLTAECEAALSVSAAAGERFRLWQRRGFAIVSEHWLLYARLHLQGMLLELSGPERDHTGRFLYGPAVLDAAGMYSDAGLERARTANRAWDLEAVRLLVLAWQMVLLMGLAVGAIHLVATGERFQLAALLVVPLYVLLLSGGPEASPRFRVVYLPWLAVVTACGWLRLWRWLRPDTSRGLVPAAGPVVGPGVTPPSS
jgi:4-amino-4-deoxy-L-arabinose transferase-like glycosyltransferase